MWNFLVYLLVVAVAVTMMAADPESGPVALIVVSVLSGILIFLIRRYTDEGKFLTNIFLAGLSARLVFGCLLHVYQLRDFAGPDSLSYDVIGRAIADYWQGLTFYDQNLRDVLSVRGPGWGMNYFMGLIYFVLGPSIFVAQSICATIGAATIPMVYFCARSIFQNKSVARASAVLIAFFPALVIWSAQLLKDGLIVFLLVVAVTMVIQLQRKFDWLALSLLVVAMGAILSLRFYTFYVIAVAIIASFAIGIQTSMKATFQRLTALTFVALALTYFGFIKIASGDLNTYGSLDRIQFSRNAMTRSDSGYGGDVDVSTTGGALSALPVGFAYLMFAPFPWEMRNLRQTLTLPDVLLWWAMIPLMAFGIWYSIRHKMRANIPIFVFVFILTIAYSMFQGNLGAAYRQRTQLQVFLLLFVAVGWTIIRERRADRKLLEERRIKEMVRRQRAILEQSPQI
jgi:hypothetical protein